MCLCVLVLVSLLACATLGHQSSPPVVNTVQGKVLGKYVSLQGFAQPVAVFLGVPFAKPPLGALRFAPPQPAEPWSFVKNTTSYPPMCSQDPVAGQRVNDHLTNRKEKIPLIFSEDCLYLNIYTPAELTKTSRLPVMVWIHGGGLVLGGASTYDGLALAAHEDVVVVTIQYRLGIWGFFSTGDEHSLGNWGHLDQVAALRWVQDNIASFGGNPGSVTIFGESAGGESVSVLVLSPLARNLFHRAISESGVALSPGLLGKNVRSLAEQVAVTAGCTPTTSAVMVHCLRQRTEKELLETTLKLRHVFVPVVIDGVLIPMEPEKILAEKNFNTVPYIVGINKQEFGWILPTNPEMLGLGKPGEMTKTEAGESRGFPLFEVQFNQSLAISFLQKFKHMMSMSEKLIPVIVEKYLEGTDDPAQTRDRFLDLLADMVFGVPSVVVSRGHRDAGAPTYMYEFQYRPSFSPDMKPMTVIGDHGDEVYSVFGAPILREGASEEEINLSKMVMKFWANFARTGNPNGEGLPHWPEYDQKEAYLEIGTTTQAAYRLKGKEMAFWTELLTDKQVQQEHTEL